MFVRRLEIVCVAADGSVRPAALRALDSFSMRNFTNDAIFDDTLPVGDGQLRVGHRVPLEALREHMDDWFRRKGHLAKEERLRITEPFTKPAGIAD